MAQGLELFHQQVRPLLLQNCFKCHGGESVESGLNMTDRDGLLKGGDTGVVVVVGKSHDSLLYKLISHSQKPHMPSEAPKLSPEAIARIAEWIDLGAPYDGPLKPMTGPLWTRERIAGQGAKFLVVSTAASCRAAGGEKCRVVPHAHRSIHPGENGSGRRDAESAGQQAAVDPPALFRSRWPAADAGRDRRLRRRSRTRCL